MSAEIKYRCNFCGTYWESQAKAIENLRCFSPPKSGTKWPGLFMPSYRYMGLAHICVECLTALVKDANASRTVEYDFTKLKEFEDRG